MAPVGLLATVGGMLGHAATDWGPLEQAAWAGLILYLAATWRGIPVRGQIYLGIALTLAAVAVAALPAPLATFATALRRSVFVITLFTALGFLREAAETSPMVRRCGLFLASQPPGRRYVALTTGGHLFGLILNFGVISLLGAMVVGAARAAGDADEPARTALRQRRMLTAVLRGFASILAWSPLTVSLAVIMTALPQTEWTEVAPWCLGTAVMLLALGWAQDRLIRPPQGLSPAPPRAPEGRWSVTAPIIALVAGIFVVGWAVEEILGVRLVVGVMMATPLIGTLWILVQQDRAAGGGAAVAATGRRLVAHGRRVFPAYRMEVALLASAAFIGSVIAALLPEDAVRALLAAAPVPPWVLLAGLSWVIVALGQAGFNPVLSVTILTGALPSPAVFGVPAEAMAVALAGAWALTANTSPFTASVLGIAQLSGRDAGTLGREWNGGYALAALVLLSAWIGVVAHLAS
ncbi:hypothetical protein ACM64Y_14155 [Novispirillum sp. DQ9]|uniref:hypothetical protein n=1 Tax=Novispirillum sp. DQ9 TaxID=3398612 RepID=UPI003C7B8C83